MAVTKAEIAGLIPHCRRDVPAGRRGGNGTPTHICSVSRSHHDMANPLRAGGELPALCGIEYAAQTMAVHGGLAGLVGAQPRAGYLISLRDVMCRKSRLDNLPGDLMVDATQLMADQGRVIYEFTLRVGAAEILSGRATVVLDTAA
jgi:predicted hotdog family 3-hydroxylacyl-ACP dehydratase